MSYDIQYATRQVATTHVSYTLYTRRTVCVVTLTLPLATHAPLLFDSVQFCSSPKAQRPPLPKKELIPSHVDWVSHLLLCYAHLYLQMWPESLATEAWGLVCLRSREGEPCDIALGLGLLGFPRNTGIS